MGTEVKKIFDLLDEVLLEEEDERLKTKLEDIHLILCSMFPISAE